MCGNQRGARPLPRKKEVNQLKKGLAIVVFVVGIITMLCGAAATTMGAVGLSSSR